MLKVKYLRLVKYPRVLGSLRVGFLSLLVSVQSSPPHEFYRFREALVELWICLSRFCEGLV